MYELIKVNKNDYYIDCPAKIGVVKISDNDVVLIDSGSDKDVAKKIVKILDANNWKLKCIYNTHSHADHIGGNHYLQEKTDCKIYTSILENNYVTNPILEPISLYGGLPFKDIQNKFLMAQDCNADIIDNSNLHSDLTVINLPGHSMDMIGFLTNNGTAYIADCISSPETIQKYGITYMWNYSKALQSLEFLKTLNARYFVPSHAKPSNNIIDLIDLNIDSIRKVENTILSLCNNPKTIDEILKCVFDNYSLTMSIQQYVLIGSTVKSYLSDMYSNGKIEYLIIDNSVKWHKI